MSKKINGYFGVLLDRGSLYRGFTLCVMVQCLNTVFTICGLQPRDRTAILGVNTIEFFVEEFT